MTPDVGQLPVGAGDHDDGVFAAAVDSNQSVAGWNSWHDDHAGTIHTPRCQSLAIRVAEIVVAYASAHQRSGAGARSSERLIRAFSTGQTRQSHSAYCFAGVRMRFDSGHEIDIQRTDDADRAHLTSGEESLKDTNRDSVDRRYRARLRYAATPPNPQTRCGDRRPSALASTRRSTRPP